MNRILIVDDDSAVRATLVKIFRNEPYVIMEATNGREALKLCQKNQVDLIITDIIMPEMEGIETIMEIRKQYSDIKIIAISGGGKRGADIYLSMARELGADCIFDKPVPIGDLLNAVRILMGEANNGVWQTNDRPD